MVFHATQIAQGFKNRKVSNKTISRQLELQILTSCCAGHQIHIFGLIKVGQMSDYRYMG